MKQSQAFIPTFRNESFIHLDNANTLLIQAGYIHTTSDGSITYLPLAKRVLTKIEKIIREELERISAMELLLPTFYPVKKLNVNEDEEVSNIERLGQEIDFSSSHIKVITSIIKKAQLSLEQLPLILFEFRTKYLYESQLNGIFRNHEYFMNNIFSFHQSKESLEENYEHVKKLYSNILSKLGLSYKIVDAGSQGCGGITEEFVILSDNGDKTYVLSEKSNYAATFETAKVEQQQYEKKDDMKDLTKILLGNFDTLESALHELNISPNDFIKSKVFDVDGELIVVLVRGDHELNEYKLKQVLKKQTLKVADPKKVSEIIGCSIHSVGPIKLPFEVKVIADYAIQSIQNGVTNANEDGYYYINVNPVRDFAINVYDDLRYILDGDLLPDGQGEIKFVKGYEVGHITKVGTTLSEHLNSTFVDEEGKNYPVFMGAFELCITRLLGVLSEKYRDEKGLVWPNMLAPFDLHIIPDNINDEVQFNLSEQLYNILTSYRYNVLFDDRKIPNETKNVDADLIGIPIRVLVGKNAQLGKVKVQIRRTGETFEWAKEELIDHLNEFFRIY